jgi:selenium-binding protein 1
MEHQHHKRFHASPEEALKAPPEELLYLACLHKGTGVEAPDFLAVSTPSGADRPRHRCRMRRRAHHWLNRCSSACHGSPLAPDRARFDRRASTS